MLLKSKSISAKDGQGKVVLIPQVPEDMWYVFIFFYFVFAMTKLKTSGTCTISS